MQRNPYFKDIIIRILIHLNVDSMKKQLSIGGVLLAIVFIFGNFSPDKQSVVILTAVNEEPNLPATPLDYENVKIPGHLLDIDSTDTGYGGVIDTMHLSIITDERATLGRVLFYDEKLSALENISCGTCHDQSLSFTENKPFSEGISALTKRNSMHLNDLGWTNRSGFSWDLEITTLDEMIVLPLTDENEIGANMLEVSAKLAETSYYPDLFRDAYGTSEINEERIVDALVQFISSMTTFNSKLDQAAANDFRYFTDEEIAGKELFSQACAICHSQGITFGVSDPDFSPVEIFPFLFNNGLPVDLEDAGAGEWNSEFENLFKVPTLRNIELTAPYMHDGRFNTLEEVVEHYSEDVEENEWTIFIPDGGFNFSVSDKENLVAFMKTFTDKDFITDEKWSDPFKLSSTNNIEGFSNLVLKPNPMSEYAVIEFDNENSNLVSVNILNAEGKLLRHDKTTGNSYSMYKEDFQSGMYFIELIMDDARSVQKLIVK